MPAQVPPWHLDVDSDDDRRLTEIMERRYEETGERPTKAGTIRRAVRALWRDEVEGSPR